MKDPTMEPELPDLPKPAAWVDGAALRWLGASPSRDDYIVTSLNVSDPAGARTALFTADQMRQCYRMGVEAERESLPVQWVGKDGTSHEVTLDYAAEICRWVFDTHGDVDQVDAAIRKG